MDPVKTIINENFMDPGKTIVKELYMNPGKTIVKELYMDHGKTQGRRLGGGGANCPPPLHFELLS